MEKRGPADFERALSLQRAGQFDQAAYHYRLVLQTHPTHFDAAHMLGATPGEVRAELAALVKPAEDDGEHEAAARNVKSYGSVKDKDVVRQKSKGRR